MVLSNAPQSSGRRFYISDPKKINEQECYDQGLKTLATDDEIWFEVHWHGYDDHCKYKLEGLALRRDLDRCYVINKEDIR